MKIPRNQRILIVDDQESIHDDFRKIIGKRERAGATLNQVAEELFGASSAAANDDQFEGFDLDSAFQGMEGFERVEQSLREGRPYAVAFVDVRMPPGWDGIQTVKQLWTIDPDILVVLCTAYSDYSWDEMARELGRSDRFLILKKPFDNIEVRQLAIALSEKWHLARTDPLTGLMNRRAFHEHFEREWNRAERHGTALSCVLMDIDFFKRINDMLGHAAGDEALKDIASVLKNMCRGSDYACRYGGEEFCILLPETNEAGAAIWAERVRAAVGSVRLTGNDGKPWPLSASFGVAERLGDTANQEVLISRADQAMMIAKQSGRNRVALYGSLGRPIGLDLADPVNPDDLFRGVLACHVMATPVACLKQQTTVGAASDFFLQARLNSAPVVDDEGKLVGILSEKDVMSHMQQPDIWERSISEFMQTNVVSYSEDTPMQTIFDFLCRVTIRRVVIVDEGQPTGVISRGSLLRWYTNWSICRKGHGSREVPWVEHCVEPPLPRLAAAAQAIVDHARRLADEVESDSDDLVPPVVEGASRMQELINDVLAYSRYLNLTASQDGSDNHSSEPDNEPSASESAPVNEGPLLGR